LLREKLRQGGILGSIYAGGKPFCLANWEGGSIGLGGKTGGQKWGPRLKETFLYPRFGGGALKRTLKGGGGRGRTEKFLGMGTPHRGGSRRMGITAYAGAQKKGGEVF